MKINKFFSNAPYKIYVENLEVSGGKKIVMIPGAYHTGVCYTQTPDNRKGWATLFYEKGFDVLVTDLPATGRSGFVDFDKIDSKFIVEAYVNLIKSLEGEIILLTHSLSGPIGFKVAEILPKKITHLISIEPGLVGNVQEVSSPSLENEDVVRIIFKGFEFELKMKEWSSPSQSMIERLSKTCTKRFPQDDDSINQYINSLQNVHPKLFYERFNIKGSQLKICNYENLKHCKLLIVTGTEDPVHKNEDYKIAEDLKKNDVNVYHLLLAQEGMVGNGHMMMLENNNNDILEMIFNWINT